MRKIILFLSLIGLLGLLLLARGLLADWRYVMEGAPGDLLYAAAFDGFTEEWQQYRGQDEAQIGEGRLVIGTSQAVSGPFSVAQPWFADFDLRVVAQPLEGPLDNGYGVIFRLQTNDPSTPRDDAYYLFLISSDGYYQVRRVIAGDVRELSTWIPSPHILQGLDVVNHLRVVAAGDQFRFFINGEAVALCIPDDPTARSTYIERSGECLGGQMRTTLIDDSIGQGQVGLIVLSLGTPGVRVAFDNLLIFQPIVEVNETRS